MDPTRVADEFHPIVVTPTFNNGATLAEVLDGVSQWGLPLLVVNDGSTDQTRSVLETWLKTRGQALTPADPGGRGSRRAEAGSKDAAWQEPRPPLDPRTTALPRSHPGTQVVTHTRNRGKAAALRSGFKAAMDLGYTHAITLDTDLQHDPAYIGPLLEAARDNPDAYVLGVRDDRAEGYPPKSRVGRRISNLLIRLECGVKVSDSQCGMRVWPLELIREVRGRASRFGYESEMITRAGWAGCPIVEVPINTLYLPPDQRVSHFRPWADSMRSIAMHARLLGRALLPLPNPIYHPHGTPLRKRVTWRDLLKWMNPMRAWREMREGRIGRNEFALALSVGVFVANLPVYPFQTLTALYLARRLHLNPLAVLGGTQLSTPPINIALIAAAVWLGHLIRHGAVVTIPAMTSIQGVWEFLARPFLIDWVVGAPIVGFVLGAITFALAHRFYRGIEDEEDQTTEPPVEPDVGVNLRKKAS